MRYPLTSFLGAARGLNRWSQRCAQMTLDGQMADRTPSGASEHGLALGFSTRWGRSIADPAWRVRQVPCGVSRPARHAPCLR